MKKTLLTTLLSLAAIAGYSQGTVNFNNRVTAGTGAQGPIVAPIYGVNPANPTAVLNGQSATGNPVGSTDYTGHPLLTGTGFTAQLWGGPGGAAEGALTLCLNGTTTFRTGTGAGFITALANAAAVNDAPAGPGSRATLQVRAWDNLGGTITSWAQALANPNVAQGSSLLFTPGFDLGGGATLPPNLIGLTSFNLHVVPEPSVIALDRKSVV